MLIFDISSSKKCLIKISEQNIDILNYKLQNKTKNIKQFKARQTVSKHKVQN